MRVRLIAYLAAGLTACTTAESASEAQTVKITPLGSHAGEFCAFDSAMIFEDPDGTRLLYDVGRTERGAEDARLGSLEPGLMSPVHGEDTGERTQAGRAAGSCTELDARARGVRGGTRGR